MAPTYVELLGCTIPIILLPPLGCSECSNFLSHRLQRAHASPQQDTNSITITQKRRESLPTARDRRKLAGSAIRVWVARAILARRIRRRMPFSELKLRWEFEVHRIAATRIQSVVRGMKCRRELERALRAAINIQRVARGRQGRFAAKRLLAQNRYVIGGVGGGCEGNPLPHIMHVIGVF